jgi:hypothetical protein
MEILVWQDRSLRKGKKLRWKVRRHSPIVFLYQSGSRKDCLCGAKCARKRSAFPWRRLIEHSRCYLLGQRVEGASSTVRDDIDSGCIGRCKGRSPWMKSGAYRLQQTRPIKLLFPRRRARAAVHRRWERLRLVAVLSLFNMGCDDRDGLAPRGHDFWAGDEARAVCGFLRILAALRINEVINALILNLSKDVTLQFRPVCWA